jgi:uncharacterized Zn ribbon protein
LLDFNKAGLKISDNVTLAKDLVVKGENFTDKQGTVVRGIRLTSIQSALKTRLMVKYFRLL